MIPNRSPPNHLISVQLLVLIDTPGLRALSCHGLQCLRSMTLHIRCVNTTTGTNCNQAHLNAVLHVLSKLG
ncbi:hypothetical protein V8F06_004304 [Rhypophila decipiens]